MTLCSIKIHAILTQQDEMLLSVNHALWVIPKPAPPVSSFYSGKVSLHTIMTQQLYEKIRFLLLNRGHPLESTGHCGLTREKKPDDGEQKA